MKQNLLSGLAVVALLFIGYAVWSDQSNGDAALNAAREKRTAALRQVANDRTAVKTACSKKGNAGACSAAQSQYKSNLAVYHADEAAFRAAKKQRTPYSSHSPNGSSHHAGSAHASAYSHH